MKINSNILLKMLMWVAAIIVVPFVLLVVYELTQLPRYTSESLQKIHSQKLTMEDVDGKHLPPTPDPKLVDATVQGIDANNNGIRDDVELAISKKYPDDIKLRAAALQYAMTNQMFLTDVFNTETWKAVAEESGRANLCVRDTGIGGKSGNELTEEVRSLIFNTKGRVALRDKTFRYVTSYGSASGKACDVDIK